MSRFGLVVRHEAGKQKGLGEHFWPSRKAGKQPKGVGSIPRLRLSFLFKKGVFCRHCLVTLALTINEALKQHSLLHMPMLIQESF